MRPELDEALVRDFPYLFRLRHHRDDGPREPISFGFTIEDGWEPLIRRLAERLEPIAATTDLRAVQVKEKSAALRFYVEHGSLPAEVMAHVRATILAARDESERTCERCGAPSVLRGVSYVQTLCSQCADRVAMREREPER